MSTAMVCVCRAMIQPNGCVREPTCGYAVCVSLFVCPSFVCVCVCTILGVFPSFIIMHYVNEVAIGHVEFFLLVIYIVAFCLHH